MRGPFICESAADYLEMVKNILCFKRNFLISCHLVLLANVIPERKRKRRPDIASHLPYASTPWAAIPALSYSDNERMYLIFFFKAAPV